MWFAGPARRRHRPQAAGSRAKTFTDGWESTTLPEAGAGQRILTAQTEMWSGAGAPPGDVTLRLVGAMLPPSVQCR